MIKNNTTILSDQDNDTLSEHLIEYDIGEVSLTCLKDYQKKYIYKFLHIYNQTNGIRGNKLITYLNGLRQTNGENVFSYKRFASLSKLYRTYGILAIIPQWGKNYSTKNIKEEWLSLFTERYLKMGSPDALTCWVEMVAHILRNEKNVQFNDIPTLNKFIEKFNETYPDKASKYLHRIRKIKGNNILNNTSVLGTLKKDDSVDLFQLKCSHFYNLDIDPLLTNRLLPHEWLYVFEWLNILLLTIDMDDEELKIFCDNFTKKNNFKFLSLKTVIEKRKTFKVLIECFSQAVHNTLRHK